MTQGKGFWGKLLSRSDRKSVIALTDISSSQKAELQDALKSEYGIEIMNVDFKGTDLMQNGYRKMSSNETAQASMILQYIPQIAALAFNNKAVNAAFKAATEGTFRVRLPEGLHLAISKLTPDAFRAMGFDSKNNLAANAELIPNVAKLSIPTAPQIALGVFSILSCATGQYFMAQINGKMEAITSGIDRIDHFLEDSRRGKLLAACQELNEQTARIEFINSEHDASEIISHLNGIRMEVRGYIPHYQSQINAMTAGMRNKDKADDIDRKIKSLATHLQEYRYAVHLVSMTKLLELRIKNVMDLDQMEMYRQEISECVEQYKVDYQTGERACKEYLEQSRALNKKSLGEYFLKAAGYVADAVVAVKSKTPVKPHIADTVNSIVENGKSKRKKRSVESVNARFASIGSLEELDAPVNTINGFIEVLKKPIEIVCVDDAYYTNLPCGEVQ